MNKLIQQQLQQKVVNALPINTIDVDIKDLVKGNFDNNLTNCLNGSGVAPDIITQILNLMDSILQQFMDQFNFFGDIQKMQDMLNSLSNGKIASLSSKNKNNNFNSIVQDAKKPIKTTQPSGEVVSNNYSENYPNTYGSTDEIGNFSKINMQTGEISFSHASGTSIKIDKSGNVFVSIKGNLTVDVAKDIVINSKKVTTTATETKHTVSGNTTAMINGETKIISPTIKLQGFVKMG